MLISHECPISMLSQSMLFNDYDYALVHLFKDYPKYKQFFKASKRVVILDNSIFELGQSYDIEEFIKEANDVRPSHIIVPDSLQNKDETLRKLKQFKEKSSLLDYSPKIIAVVQGRTLTDSLECYEMLLNDKFVDVIAISFDYSFYETMYKSLYYTQTNCFMQWMLGRQIFMDIIAESYNNTKPVHLLGCGVAKEFEFYKNSKFDFILSLDTSNPIVHGMLGIPFNENGVVNKESIKVSQMITQNITRQQQKIIYYNIKKFRQMVQR